MYGMSTELSKEEFKCVIIATGASARYLGLPGEEDFIEFRKSGLTACATCDGASPIYREKPICVVGGGDVAAEEALIMTKFASKVFVIHRRDQLRASKVMADRVLKHENIQVLWNKVITEYKTDEKNLMCAVMLKDTVTGESEELKVNGVFMAIGHKPNTGFLDGLGLKLDAAKYLVVEKGSLTNVEGIFAAGDVRDSKYRQAVSAAGYGCMAALEAQKYLESLE